MKIVDVDTVGGRIRACRQAMNLTLANLAEKINVSSNYISILERGDKNPSDKVLHKIADFANVSYWWLKTGQEESPVSFNEPISLNAVPVNVDVPLFLSLAIQSIPGMTKEKLAAKLDISPGAMDNILFEDGDAAAPDWADYFSILARQMDLPAVRKKIRNLDLFLQNESVEKERKRLLDLAKRCAGSEYQYFVSNSMQRKGADIPSDPEIHTEHIALRQSESLKGKTWHFVFYRFAGTIDSSLVKAIMGDELSYCDEIYGNLTLVFDDDEVLSLFQNEYERRQCHNDALAGTPYDSGDRLPPISLLLIDRETWEQRGEIIYLEDNA